MLAKILQDLFLRIHITKNYQKWIRNQKIMALQSVHGQKVKKVPHPTLGNCFENTQKLLVCCSATFRVQRGIIELKVALS
jgi:hypothetical protein